MRDLDEALQQPLLVHVQDSALDLDGGLTVFVIDAQLAQLDAALKVQLHVHVEVGGEHLLERFAHLALKIGRAEMASQEEGQADHGPHDQEHDGPA